MAAFDEDGANRARRCLGEMIKGLPPQPKFNTPAAWPMISVAVLFALCVAYGAHAHS